jgi:hypothetical protein
VKIGFEAPESVGDMLNMLNRGGNWQFTLVTPEGVLLGHLEGNTDISPITPDNTVPERFLILSGDVDEAKMLFAAETAESAAAFVYGCFLLSFGGRSLEDIQDELQRRPEQQIY